MPQIKHIHRALATLGLCFAQAACLTAPLEGDADEESVASVEAAVMSTNRLTMNRLTMNRLTMNGLSKTKLGVSNSQLSTTQLIETEEGRELLKYIVRCALPDTQSLSATHAGTTYTFQGNIGLAPEWRTQPLSRGGQRWITACLLAHVNGYGIEVPISVRGDLDALATTSSELEQFSAQEAAFYGNIFVATSDPEYGLYACAGSTVHAQCGSGAGTYVPQRACGTNASCELSFVGPCSNEAAPEQNACESTSSTLVEECYPEPMGQDEWSGVAKYSEVLTVYLKSSDFNGLYTGCDSM